MPLYNFVAACLLPLAAWILLSGLDDIFVGLVFVWHCLRERRQASRFRWPSEADLDQAPARHIAILVPLWREHEVIASMLEHNIAAIRYAHYHVFAGAYPNDPDTIAALEGVCARAAHVHIAVNSQPGPTSKADCLNSIYRHMRQYEEQHGIRFDVIVTHDAEDLIHPESLRLINYYSATYDMVQVPVLALPTPWHEFTHGLYCDEFAEFQTKDMPVRQLLGGFLPSNGVGTGFSRQALEQLAPPDTDRIFDPECLTEDYENGYRLHAMGCSQIFLPIRRQGGPVATREYFPRRFRAAWKQRARWTMGIALQAWERHGWRERPRQLYWFWRDRKGLAGNLVAPLANLFFLYGMIAWFAPPAPGGAWSPSLAWLFRCTLAMALAHLAVRVWCVGRIYGWCFALLAPIRALWGNWLNCLATVLALKRYFAARRRKRPLAWLKTDHTYPTAVAAPAERWRLGEILVLNGHLSPEGLRMGLLFQPKHLTLGESMVREGRVSEEAICSALSQQHGVPMGIPERQLIPSATRSLPARVVRICKLLPFRIAGGQLFVAGPELPTEEILRALRRFCKLKIRFHVITQSEFDHLAGQYLP